MPTPVHTVFFFLASPTLPNVLIDSNVQRLTNFVKEHSASSITSAKYSPDWCCCHCCCHRCWYCLWLSSYLSLVGIHFKNSSQCSHVRPLLSSFSPTLFPSPFPISIDNNNNNKHKHEHKKNSKQTKTNFVFGFFAFLYQTVCIVSLVFRTYSYACIQTPTSCALPPLLPAFSVDLLLCLTNQLLSLASLSLFHSQVTQRVKEKRASHPHNVPGVRNSGNPWPHPPPPFRSIGGRKKIRTNSVSFLLLSPRPVSDWSDTKPTTTHWMPLPRNEQRPIIGLGPPSSPTHKPFSGTPVQ